MTNQRVRSTIRFFVPAVTLVLAAGLISCETGDREAAGETSPPPDQRAALHEAARTGNLAEVRRLVEESGTPIDAGDRYDSTALMMASEKGHLEVVEYLLEAGADPNHREVFFNSSSFDLALWRENVEVAIALLAAGADARDRAFEIAVQADVPELAKAAVEAGPLYESTVEKLSTGDDLPETFATLLAGAETRPDPEPPSYTAEQLREFEGVFETWDESTGEDTYAEVKATATGLRLSVADGAPVDLVVSGEREFRSNDGAVEAAFWGRLGSVESLTVHRDGGQPLRMRHSIGKPLGAEAYAYETETAAPDETADAAAGNWPQFRGDHAGGVGDGADVPPAWDVEAGTAVRWQVEIPGLGNSSPIVWGDAVIVTTAVAEGIEQDVRTGLTGEGDPVVEDVEHSWRVMAFDKKTGDALWDTEIGRAVPKTRRHFKASQANSTPVTDGEHVVVAFPTAGIACLDLDGNLKWKHDLGGLNVSSPNDPATHWGFASSPVIHDGRVILQVDTYHEPFLAAWDLETGDELWRTARDVPPSWSTPTVVQGDDGDELIVNGATIHGYDPATGKELWSLGPNSELVIATPVVGDGVVFVSAGYAPIKPIYALRPGGRGDLDVEPGDEHEQLAWSHARGGAYMPTPILYRGLLYVVHHNARMVAYDADTGAPIYKTRFSQGGTFTASPVAANGMLFVPTEEGQVYAIEAGPEYRELAVNEMNEPVMATPAISDGTLFVRTTRRLVAVGS
jgi:outer membrane protein assembly factor BamB